MESPRRHPDLFTGAEALEYLHLASDQERTLETFRLDYGLPAQKMGRELMYHRADLDALVVRIFEHGRGATRQKTPTGPRLKVGG